MDWRIDRSAQLCILTATLSDPPSTSPAQKVLNYLIEDVRLRTYLIVFLAVVLACGWLYSCLTEHGHGVNTPGLGFLEGVFFSIVTVTSLGYGDIYPVGFSRVIAGFEVLFGLALMGIISVDPAYRDGIERYLGEYLKPKVGTNFPEAVPIPIQLPW